MKKISIKTLLIGLAALIAVFAASRFFRSPGLESNLRRELLVIDTASITEVRILPSKERTEELRLARDGKNWKVQKGTRIEPAAEAAVKGILATLANLKAQRLASRKKEKWDEFKVGETSTHVSVHNKGKKLADFHVGKLGFTQNGTGQFGGSYTYVRLSDENEVYTVDGFLEPAFNNTFTEWRDKTLIKLNKDDITKLSFRYPLDSGFVLAKRDSLWYVGNDLADPSKVNSALSPFSTKYLTEFVDGFTPKAAADVVIQVDGKAGNLVTLEAWKAESDWVLTSSLQKGIYFSSKGSTVVDLLIGKKKILPG